MNILLLLSLLFAVIALVRAGPTITSPSGQIQGTVKPCGLFCSYYSFKGIPYAESPIGDLRFRNPVSHPGWSGVRDGSQHRPVCPQIDMFSNTVIGDEDCLYLNVYTQELIGQRPVLVVIHGGGYSAGMGDDYLHGPQKLVREGIVLVTINYRLGALGFLSTGDENAQGNWGMKDCIEALRWMQRNIVAFGGDPSSVTIYGNSAGGALVHLLSLSDMADGLFHKAIAQSGTALTPFAFQTNPKFYADRMAESLGFLTNDSAVYMDQLRTVSAISFIEFQEAIYDVPVPRLLRALDFSPSIEPIRSPEPRAIIDLPINLMKARPNRIPFMIGYNDLEGSYFTTSELLFEPAPWDPFNANPHLFVPFFWNINEESTASSAVSYSFQQFYFNGQPVGPDLEFQWAQYYGDHMFIFPIDVTAREYGQAEIPVYYYQFSYDGDLNLFKKMLGIAHPGAVHIDEHPYIFEVEATLGVQISPTSHANTVSSRVVRLMANFVKYGNPTPSTDPLLQNTIWPTVQDDLAAVPILDIGHDLEVVNAANLTKLQLWHHLQDRYAVNPFQ